MAGLWILSTQTFRVAGIRIGGDDLEENDHFPILKCVAPEENEYFSMVWFDQFHEK